VALLLHWPPGEFNPPSGHSARQKESLSGLRILASKR
jgi:hypothetical protein